MSENSHKIPGSPHVNHSRDFVRNFLFGGSHIDQDDPCIRSALFMDLHTEGWIGLPHGGIGMGAMMDLAMMLNNYPQNGESLYPLSIGFRMGGSSVRIGDRVNVKVSPENGGASGMITTEKDVLPYMSAAIRYRNDEPHGRDLFISYIPENFSDIQNKLIPLPYYKNCFVCGRDRSHPGLKRCFHLLKAKQPEKLVVSTAGFDAWDSKTFYLFQRNHIIHPIAFLALLDETMGWAGFMSSASGAVTVRIRYTFYRDIHVGERLVVFGRGEKVKGKAGLRLLFWASGGVAVVNHSGSFEVVITSSGQYLGVSELTEQMKTELIPKELTTKVFAFAGAQ